ncbi:MAG TPA: hypothetical protein VF657_00825, partial [Actinoplanes sp.]
MSKELVRPATVTSPRARRSSKVAVIRAPFPVRVILPAPAVPFSQASTRLPSQMYAMATPSRSEMARVPAPPSTRPAKVARVRSATLTVGGRVAAAAGVAEAVMLGADGTAARGSAAAFTVMPISRAAATAPAPRVSRGPRRHRDGADGGDGGSVTRAAPPFRNRVCRSPSAAGGGVTRAPVGAGSPWSSTVRASRSCAAKARAEGRLRGSAARQSTVSSSSDA